MDTQRKRHIEEALEIAMQKATSWNEVQKYELQVAKIVRDFLSESIDTTQYEKCLESLCNESQRVILHTVEEFAYVLQFLDLKSEIINDTLAHEIDHYTQAKAKWLQARFCLTFYIADNGKLAIIPGTQIHLSHFNSLSDEYNRNGLKATIAAPTILSPDDEQLLKI